MNASPQLQLSNSDRSLYIALELSSSTWKVAFTDQLGRKARLKNVAAGDLSALEQEIAKAKDRFELTEDALVVSCYEAGRDGFWIHRCLVSMGVFSHIVEPASIQVNRRHRRAKTDRIDAEMILNALLRWQAGDRFACRMIRIPDKDVEDARHIHRELKTLKGEQTSHTNRIKALLVTNGCTQVTIDHAFPQWLEQAVGGDGQPLGRRLVERLQREFERLRLVTEQIRQLQKHQHTMLRQARKRIAESEEDSKLETEQLGAEERIIALAEHLAQLKGIGVVTAWTLAAEIFSWRDIGNRRQLAALVGLVPTPHSSGNEEKEQGISKAGRGDLRVLMIEIAWLWLQYQPQSELSRWYCDRFGGGTSRERKRGIVALARKLLVALGKYVARGEIPAGALLGEKLSTNYTASLEPKPKPKQNRSTAQPACQTAA